MNSLFSQLPFVPTFLFKLGVEWSFSYEKCLRSNKMSYFIIFRIKFLQVFSCLLYDLDVNTFLGIWFRYNILMFFFLNTTCYFSYQSIVTSTTGHATCLVKMFEKSIHTAAPVQIHCLAKIPSSKLSPFYQNYTHLNKITIFLTYLFIY